MPRMKRFLSEVKEGVTPQTLWGYKEVGHTQEAKKELLKVVEFEDSPSVFVTPKPTRLIRRILEVATDEDSIVLDSFAGSGTTGHAVLQANRADKGNRKFVLVEMEEGISQEVTQVRLSRVVEGYDPVQGSRDRVEPLGGGFRFCQLGPTLLDANGQVFYEVKFNDLARHVWFCETGEPWPRTGRGQRTPLLGVSGDTAIYLLFNGVLGDRTVNGGNVLTSKVLASLPEHDGPKVVYGEASRLGRERLKREGVVFKQIPYEVKGV